MECCPPQTVPQSAMSHTMVTRPPLQCARWFFWDDIWLFGKSPRPRLLFIFVCWFPFRPNSSSLLSLSVQFHFLCSRAANTTRPHCFRPATSPPLPSTTTATSSPPPTTTIRSASNLQTSWSLRLSSWWCPSSGHIFYTGGLSFPPSNGAIRFFPL